MCIHTHTPKEAHNHSAWTPFLLFSNMKWVLTIGESRRRGLEISWSNMFHCVAEKPDGYKCWGSSCENIRSHSWTNCTRADFGIYSWELLFCSSQEYDLSREASGASIRTGVDVTTHTITKNVFLQSSSQHWGAGMFSYFRMVPTEHVQRRLAWPVIYPLWSLRCSAACITKRAGFYMISKW